MTISELFEVCFKEHWSIDRYIKSGHAKEVRSKYENHIRPRFGQSGYLDVKRSEIRDWHQGFRATPITGNRCLEIVSRLYRFSCDKEWNEQGFNPCVSVKHFTERKRRRHASESELKKIAEVLERDLEKFPVEISFITTLIYTGARPRSIERSRWDELQELENGYGLLVFEGKSSEETGDLETVILPPNIMTIIHNLPKRDDGRIFGIALPSYLWSKIRKECNCKDLWLRDMRRTFATIGMSGGIKMDTIGELLNHHSTQTTKRYAMLDSTARLAAVSAINSKLQSIFKK
jgi:integrase